MIDAQLLAALVEGGDPAVSLYFPVRPDQRPKSAPEAQMRDLLERAAAALERHSLDARARDALLAPARDEAASSGFAHHRDHGFALFMATGQEPRRIVLPEPLAGPILVIGRRFHVKPLLPHVARNRRFHVLAITAGESRLYAATPQEFHEMPLDILPKEYEAEALMLEDAGQGTPHPGGAADELRHSMVVEDLRRVSFAARKALATSTAPVLLAGEPDSVGHFRALGQLPHLEEEALLGNPFALPPSELHARAVAHMRPMLDAELEAALERVRARLGTAESTVGIRPEEILAGAHEGRVDTIIVAEDSDLWGRWEPGEGTGGTLVVHGHQVDAEEELLNTAVVEALRTGGRAFAAPLERLPRQTPAAALYRY